MTDSATAPKTASAGKLLLGIIALAVIARLLVAIFTDQLDHPDENFQLLEQAHRVVFGYGLIPWEFRFAVRSWLTPGLIVVLLYPFKLLGLDNPNLYVPAIRAILGLLSVSMVLSAYHIGRKLISVRAGLTAAFLCAIWYEMIHFGIRPLSETWATVLFLGAIALAMKPTRLRHLALAGILAALTTAIRIHYLPVVAVFAIATFIALDKTGRRTFGLALVATVLAVGIFEKITLGGFYTSYLNYYAINQSYSMNAAVGESSTMHYLLYLGFSSLFVFWVLFVAGITAWKKTGLLVIYVTAVLLPHLLLPIKTHLVSMRFIFLAVPLLLIIGATAISFWEKRVTNPRLKHLACPTLCTIMLAISIIGALGALPGERLVYQHDLFHTDPHLRAYRHLYGEPSLAGLFDNSSFWFQGGGYYYLHRDIPLYYPNTPPSSPAFVSHALSKTVIPPSSGFGKMTAFDGIILYRRNDQKFQCQPDPDYSRDMFQAGIDDNPNLR